MRNLIGIPLIIFTGLLQITLLPHFTAFNLIPNIALVILVIWAFLRPPEECIVWAITAGITLDLFSSGTFGIYTLLFVLITFLISFVKQNFVSDINFPFKVLTALTAFLLFNTFYFLLQQFLNLIHIESTILVPIDYLFKLTPREILYELIAFIVILKPLEWFNEWVSRHEQTVKIPTSK